MASGPVRAAALVLLVIVGFRLQVQLHEHRMHDAPLCRPVASCSAGACSPAGLSMDYEVFILTRIREAYDATGDARHAVTEGLGRTGRLVTSAAAILMLSFLSMSTGPQTDLKILATGLGAGILIDAVVIRCLMVPAMVALFGRANWWLPSSLARVLRIPAATGPVPASAAGEIAGPQGSGDLVVTGAR